MADMEYNGIIDMWGVAVAVVLIPCSVATCPISQRYVMYMSVMYMSDGFQMKNDISWSNDDYT